MASLVLGAIGGFFFGPIGFMVGSMLGNLLFPAKGPDGPKLSNLHLQNSQYGQMIPIIYGAMKVGGNVIWQTDLQEHKHGGGGKGGPTAGATYSYSASFAVSLCEGPIASIAHIWADGTLIYGIGSPSMTLPCKLYLGDEDQLPDPAMEAIEGAGNVPGYRGQAYVVFDEWDLTDFGNRIPNLNFEVLVKSGKESPLQIIAIDMDEPHNDGPDNDAVDRWSFRWFEGPIGSVYPAITSWGMGGGDIRIRVIPTIPDVYGGLVYTYANPSLVSTGSNNYGDDFPYFTDTSLGNWWQPIGIYHYDNDPADIESLWWLNSGTRQVTTGNDYCAIASSSAIILSDDELPVAGVNFSYKAGIPAGLYVNGVALSQDGKTLLVLTDAGGDVCSAWYKIVGGAVVSNGTISPAISNIGVSSGGANTFVVNMLENNGNFMWHFDSATRICQIYKISNSNNLAYDDTAGTLVVPTHGYTRTGNPPDANPGTAVFYPSIYVPAEGYCGVAFGTTLALISRLAGPAQTTLAEVVSDISIRAGLTEDQIDVSQLTDIVDGYIIAQQQACRDNIATLRSAYFFDGVESSARVKFVKRSDDIAAAIPDDDLAAKGPDDESPALATVKRAQEVDLPAILNISYINPANDYQIGTQISQRQVVESQLTVSIQISVAMSDAKGKQIANTLLYNAWTERMEFTFQTSRKYDYLEPTDVVSVRGYEIRILNKTEVANGIVKFDGVAAGKGLWTQSPVAASGIGFTPSVPPNVAQAADLVLLDLPMITDSDDPEGLRAGIAGAVSNAWPGGVVYQSTDGGSTYNAVASVRTATTMGTVTEVPSQIFAGGNVFDRENAFEVTLGAGGGELVNASELAVLNGANYALLGNEVIKFMGAELVGTSVYKITGMLRGRRGTEWSIGQHAVGEIFVLLDSTVDVDGTLAQLGQTLQYEGVTAGMSLESSTPVQFINNGAGVLPYAPVHLGGGTDNVGDVTLQWFRRTRVGGAWNDFSDVPLGEASEQYVVQIWDSTYTYCARVISGITSPHCVYASADQVTDFGAQQKTIYFTVGQVGAYKLGHQGFGTATGAGATNDTVLIPITPYNGKPVSPVSTGCTLPVTNSTLVWGDGNTVVNSSFAPGQEWVVAFTTPALTAGRFGIYGFSPIPYNATLTATLSTIACGAQLASTSKQTGTSFALHFYLQDNPSPSLYPTLAAATTYYVSVTENITGPANVFIQFD